MAKKSQNKEIKETKESIERTEKKVSGKVKVKALTPQWLSGKYIGVNEVIEVQPEMATLLLSNPKVWEKV